MADVVPRRTNRNPPIGGFRCVQSLLTVARGDSRKAYGKNIWKQVIATWAIAG